MSNSTGPKLLSIKHDRPGIFEVGIYIARHPISSQLATFYNDLNAPWKRLNDLVAGIISCGADLYQTSDITRIQRHFILPL